MELHELGSLPVALSKLVQRLIQHQDMLGGHVEADRLLIQIDALVPSAVFRTPPAPSILDKDTAHGLRSRSKEMPAAVPVLLPFNVHQPQIRLMDEGCRLKCLSRLVMCEPGGSE